MFSVIFEVNPKEERWNDYLNLAQELKPILAKIDGFVDNERFESKTRKGWLLSHSTWRDEKSVVRWRTEEKHHHVQEQGRSEIFADYHLRVGDVVSDTNPPEHAPVHERRFDETEIAAAKFATLTEVTPRSQATFKAEPNLLPAHLGLSADSDGLIGHDVFASIYTPGKLALLASWKDAESANSWTAKSSADVQDLRHRVIRVIRDYGMFDRREAPQYYPDARPQ